VTTKAKTQVQVIQPQWWMTKQRGCGWAMPGTYISIEPGAYGTPLWEFVLDPTVPVPEGFDLAPVSMVLKSRGQVNKDGKEILDIFDWIGGDAYPNPLDWLLEVQQLGFHQRCDPRHLKHLVEESQYFAVHSRGSIYWEDLESVYAYRENFTHPHQPKCPGEHEQHINMPKQDQWNVIGTCPGLFFNDVIKGKAGTGSTMVRELPSFSWDGFEALPGIRHEPAIFARFPIGRMATWLVYQDNQGGDIHERALKELENLDAKLKRVKIVSLDGGQQ
jgi:hypothetical protein